MNKLCKERMKKDIQLSFTDKEITPWGGMSLMSRLLRRMDFQDAVQGELKWHQ